MLEAACSWRVGCFSYWLLSFGRSVPAGFAVVSHYVPSMPIPIPNADVYLRSASFYNHLLALTELHSTSGGWLQPFAVPADVYTLRVYGSSLIVLGRTDLSSPILKWGMLCSCPRVLAEYICTQPSAFIRYILSGAKLVTAYMVWKVKHVSIKIFLFLLLRKRVLFPENLANFPSEHL